MWQMLKDFGVSENDTEGKRKRQSRPDINCEVRYH